MMANPPKGINRCHHPCLNSVVLCTYPTVIRAFIATDDSYGGHMGQARAGTVAPHSHRTSIKITMLQGHMYHATLRTTDSARLGCQPVGKGRMHTYGSILLGGEGLSAAYCETEFIADVKVLGLGEHHGNVHEMPHTDIHAVEWTANAIWLIEEGPVVTETTHVLLRHGLDEFTTDGMYEPMTKGEYLANANRVWSLWKGA